MGGLEFIWPYCLELVRGSLYTGLSAMIMLVLSGVHYSGAEPLPDHEKWRNTALEARRSISLLEGVRRPPLRPGRYLEAAWARQSVMHWDLPEAEAPSQAGSSQAAAPLNYPRKWSRVLPGGRTPRARHVASCEVAESAAAGKSR